MNSRQKRKLLRNFLKLIGTDELDESDYSELVQKLAIQFNKGDGAVIELLEKLNKIYKTSKTGNEKIKAVRMAIEEFLAKVIAETIIRGSRGF